MDTPSLKTEWTPEELKTQRQQWQNVAGLSEKISNAALQSDWETLLPLAEERQLLMDEFFQKPICLPLFQTISDQLAAIQKQHEMVASLITSAIGQNEAKASQLMEQRELMVEITQSH
jgi:hypothetical protein